MQNDLRVNTLAQALAEHGCKTVEEVMSILEQAVVVDPLTGDKAVELTDIEGRLGLPVGFFAQAAGREEGPRCANNGGQIKD